MTTPCDTAVRELFALLQPAATQAYFGESLSQLDHALQCAALAGEAGSDEATVLAALLHDIGHLCAPAGTAHMSTYGIIGHERIGAAFLRQRGFSPRVTDLAQGHVAAKRYLVWRDSAYMRRLSTASVQTLAFQGGPMSPQEARAFEHDPLAEQKLRLRSWDEWAKRSGWKVPPLEAYRDMLVRHLQEIRQQLREPR
jgi:phosphonate degradation associated HDIG domain protein